MRSEINDIERKYENYAVYVRAHYRKTKSGKMCRVGAHVRLIQVPVKETVISKSLQKQKMR